MILDAILSARTTAPVDSDGLAEHLWARMHCDPEDPHPEQAWADVLPVTREFFTRIADEARAYIAANPEPDGYRVRLRRWQSAFDIPIGTTFRPLHDQREYVRIDDNARALPPAIDGVKIPLNSLNEAFSRGFVEVPRS